MYILKWFLLLQKKPQNLWSYRLKRKGFYLPFSLILSKIKIKGKNLYRSSIGYVCGPQHCFMASGMFERIVFVQSCPTLCDPMDCSTPGFPVLHYLPKFAHTHIHWVSDAIQPSHPLSPPSPLALHLSQHQDLFQWVSSSHHIAKVLEL